MVGAKAEAKAEIVLVVVVLASAVVVLAAESAVAAVASMVEAWATEDISVIFFGVGDDGGV